MNHQAKTALYFFKNGKFISTLREGQHRAVFGSADTALAEQLTSKASGAGLLATDTKGSPLLMQDRNALDNLAFSAYGHGPDSIGSGRLLGFNGELIEPAMRLYLLGAGYHRPFSTSLMRFLSSDNQSPFGIGGINSYAYCEGDPINHSDPSGHGILKNFNIVRKAHEKNHKGNKLPPVSSGIMKSAKETILAYPDLPAGMQAKFTVEDLAKSRSHYLASTTITKTNSGNHTTKGIKETITNLIQFEIKNYEIQTIVDDRLFGGEMTQANHAKAHRTAQEAIELAKALRGVMKSHLERAEEVGLS